MLAGSCLVHFICLNETRGAGLVFMGKGVVCQKDYVPFCMGTIILVHPPMVPLLWVVVARAAEIV